jgi:hypothetical protein
LLDLARADIVAVRSERSAGACARQPISTGADFGAGKCRR